MLATFVVANLDDAGPGSLRGAIERANADPDRDTVTFAPGLAGTIVLAEALPDLTTPIDIVGPGAAVLTIAAGPAEGTPPFRLVTSNVSDGASISDLTLAGGTGDGGGVRNLGVLSISGVSLRDFRATDGSGGAIANEGPGSLSIADSALIGNRAIAGAFPFKFGSSAAGGAIANEGNLAVANTTFEDNQAQSSSFGGLGSSATSRGGAIRNVGTLSIAGSTFLGNRAVSGTALTSSSLGGAIENSGTLTIADSTFRDNLADASAIRVASGRGGAIQNAGVLRITGSAFVSNEARSSHGFGAGGTGGAIENLDGAGLLLTNSTVSGNRSASAGGISNAGVLAVIQSTIADNAGGGIINAFPPPSPLRARVTIGNSLFAEGAGGTLVNFDGQVTSLGGNLFSDTPDLPLVPSDLVATDPLLAPLGDHGGPTPTRALLPGSPAIGAAAPLADVTTDQRGVPRPVGTAPDIGAFESRGFDLTVDSGDNQSTPVNTPFPEPLVVRATSPTGEPVAGGQVIFEASEAGPAASFASPAVIGPEGLASTTATANAVPGTFTAVATAAGSNPVQFTLTNRVDALAVVNVARFGFHARPTRIDLAFNRPLDPSQAARVENYRLLGPGLDRAPAVRPDRPLRLRSASYDAATNTVSLVPAQPLRLLGGRRYLVVVDGAVATGATSGGTTAIVGAEDFVPPPSVVRQLNLIRRLQRSRDGTGRLR